MGHGIAQVAAAAAFRTTLYDLSEELVRAGLERVEANLEEGVERGKVSDEQRRATLDHLRATTDLAAAVRDADLVVEAVPEDLDLKQSVFSDVETAAPESCILASNTSSLSIEELAAGLQRPGRFLGMHFFNPVHIMELLEVVVHAHTDDAVREAAVDIAERMGKTAIVVQDSPGFATSRLGVALGLEAMRMLEEGVARAEDIDRAMELGYRHPMGPLRLTDLVGLDVRLGIARYLHDRLGSPVFEPPRILEEKVERGELGKKAGAGFYQWDERGRSPES